MSEKDKLKEALRHQLGAAAENLDLDKIVEETLATQDQAPEHEPSEGFYIVVQDRNGQHLAIYPPEHGGLPVTAEEIFEDLEKKQIYYESRTAIIKQASKPDGEPLRISAKVEDYHNLGNDLSVKVSRDELQAYLTVPGGLWPDFRQQLRKTLDEEGIIYGIIERKVVILEQLVRKKSLIIRNTVIAKGLLPTKGRPARLRYEFDVNRNPTPLKMPDGSVNYYQLNMIKNVRQDQTLVVKYPAEYGDPGITVKGNTIAPLKGKDLPLTPGKNVKITDDGLKMFAAANGHAHAVAGVIGVDSVYTVVGDVDYSTGNLDIDGSLVITGWIRTGFEVSASSDIEIIGGVEGAAVNSRGGSIYINGGIQGQGRARLSARYDIHAFHAENAWLLARRNIIIKDSLMHSLAVATNSVQVFSKRGVIIGGVVRARGNILAKQVGSDVAAKTELRIENIEGQALQDELDHIDQKLGKLLNEKKLIERHVLSKFSNKGGGQVGNDFDDMDELIRFSDLDTRIKMHQARSDELKRSLGIPDRSNIKVKDVVHPGVVIHFGGASLMAKERYQFVTFYYKDNEIRFLPFQE